MFPRCVLKNRCLSFKFYFGKTFSSVFTNFTFSPSGLQSPALTKTRNIFFCPALEGVQLTLLSTAAPGRLRHRVSNTPQSKALFQSLFRKPALKYTFFRLNFLIVWSLHRSGISWHCWMPECHKTWGSREGTHKVFSFTSPFLLAGKGKCSLELVGVE